MEDTRQILANAHQRARQMNLPYRGALLPAEAFGLMSALPEAKLVDIRTQAELEWVGRVPGSVEIEWNRWPGNMRNLNFLAEFEARIDKNAIAMFLCRSGGRSHQAAITVTQAGHPAAYNVLQGFEGDKNPSGQRNRLGGWRAAGLPWTQS
jgi:rhodanese-related sulfurtransferase